MSLISIACFLPSATMQVFDALGEGNFKMACYAHIT